MDYPEGSGNDTEALVLTSFLRGYRSIRDFSEEQRNWYPYLCAVIDAFWSSDIRWNENSLVNTVKNGDMQGSQEWLETILLRLTSLKTIPGLTA